MALTPTEHFNKSNWIKSNLHHRKPSRKVKLVSVHASPVYASSVSELVKPLNVSKPVCSSNATKRNVCNTNSVSQHNKPLADLSVLVKQLNITSVTPVMLVNSLNHYMLVNFYFQAK